MRIFWYSGDERSRQALTAELSRQGHLVRCAETPELPLEGEDLVLLQLPRISMNRSCLCANSASGPHRTPLVALGVWQLAADIAPVLDCGADDYIPLPCAPEVLALRLAVAAHLARKHSAAGEQNGCRSGSRLRPRLRAWPRWPAASRTILTICLRPSWATPNWPCWTYRRSPPSATAWIRSTRPRAVPPNSRARC